MVPGVPVLPVHLLDDGAGALLVAHPGQGAAESGVALLDLREPVACDREVRRDRHDPTLPIQPRVTHPDGSDTINRMRIVSLLPSTTEILFAIGAGDDVVGVTFECDYPPEARSVAIVSTSALPEGLDSAGIDATWSAAMRAGEDLYHLDEGALAGLDADLVVTQDLCAVCAVDVSRGRRRAGPSRLHRRGADDRPAHPRRGARLDRDARRGHRPPRPRPSNWSTRCGRGSTAVARAGRRQGPPERHRGCWCSSGPTRPSRRATGCRRWSRRPAAYPRIGAAGREVGPGHLGAGAGRSARTSSCARPAVTTSTGSTALARRPGGLRGAAGRHAGVGGGRQRVVRPPGPTAGRRDGGAGPAVGQLLEHPDRPVEGAAQRIR